MSSKTLQNNAPNTQPFGTPLYNRGFTFTSGYRYGYGGHEKDDEIAGKGNHLSFNNFGYDSRLGRRWNTDPLTRGMPSFSPYSYAKDNPVLFIDIDGQYPFTFYVRSYEHSAVFATPFTSAGDNRSSSTSSSASARIHYKMDIETDGNKLEKYRAWSSPSIQFMYPIVPFSNTKVDVAHPKYDANADNKGNYSFNAAAAEPIMSKLPVVGGLTPNIDIKGAMKITEDKGLLNIKGQIKGDGFPNAETFIKDKKGQSVMLGTYEHGAAGSPLWSLPGDGNKPMITVNVQIELNKDGNFAKAWSIDEKGNKTALSIVPPEKKAEKK